MRDSRHRCILHIAIRYTAGGLGIQSTERGCLVDFGRFAQRYEPTRGSLAAAVLEPGSEEGGAGPAYLASRFPLLRLVDSISGTLQMEAFDLSEVRLAPTREEVMLSGRKS